MHLYARLRFRSGRDRRADFHRNLFLLQHRGGYARVSCAQLHTGTSPEGAFLPTFGFYTAEAEGETAAYIKLNFGSAQTENFPGLAEVQRLYVLKKYKRAGLGTALMRQAERRARESGAAGLWLGVWEHNYPAQHFISGRALCASGSIPSCSAKTCRPISSSAKDLTDPSLRPDSASVKEFR